MPIDKTDPIDHTKIGDVPGEIRQVKSNVIDTVAMEHVTPTDAVTGGEHLAGAARVYLQSGLATTSPDGNNLATAADGPATNYDYGRVNVDTSDYNFIKVFNPAASSTMTGCWENVSVGGVKASTNIDANSKNVVNLAAGTLTGQPIHVGQIDTSCFKILEPATGAVVEVKISTGLETSHGGGIFLSSISAQTTQDSLSATMVTGTIYQAQSDGFVTVVGIADAGELLELLCDSSSNPTRVVDSMISDGGNRTVQVYHHVRKDYYFKVTHTGDSQNIYWASRGAMAAPVAQ